MPIKQQNAPYEVLVPHLGKDAFVFGSMEGSESVSHTYSFRLTMATELNSVQDESLLRKPISITLRRENQPARVIHGLIAKTRLIGTEVYDKPVFIWEATVVPWLWFLNLETDCRHFIN